MGPQLKNAYYLKKNTAIRFYELNEFYCASHHLARARVLGQRYRRPHTKSHGWTLKVGSKKIIFGRTFGRCWAGNQNNRCRIISKIWLPAGSTGEADVNPLRLMAVQKI